MHTHAHDVKFVLTTVTEEQYNDILADFEDLTDGENTISHEVWTEAFTLQYGPDGKEMIAVYEAMFKALDLDHNDSITVCFFFPPSSFPSFSSACPMNDMPLFPTQPHPNRPTSISCSQGS